VAGCKQTTSTAKVEETKSTVYPLKVVDSYNRTITIEKEPKRVITIAPDIAETVYALGKGNLMVGRSDYDDYPNEVLKVKSVGQITEPSIEKIVELKPDVVIASTHFSKDVTKKLEDLGIKVVVLYGEESFDGVYNTIHKVGEVLNANEKAKTVVDGMKKKVKAVTDKVKTGDKTSVYYVVGYGKGGDYTAGGDTFIGNMLEMAGGKNVASDVKGWQYSVEKLVEKNPDILICSKNYDTKKGIVTTNGYKDLKAVKNGKLIEIDDNLVNRQGPRLADGLEVLAKAIHPELFK
jgi:iron complex transport system substrate-binding protein